MTGLFFPAPAADLTLTHVEERVCRMAVYTGRCRRVYYRPGYLPVHHPGYTTLLLHHRVLHVPVRHPGAAGAGGTLGRVVFPQELEVTLPRVLVFPQELEVTLPREARFL